MKQIFSKEIFHCENI